jgi:hypothetical protein
MNRAGSFVRILCTLALAHVVGCATAKGTGALAGGGMGALIGAAAGDTQGALIGAAIGTGVGYIIGDQVDEKKAKDIEAGKAKVEVAPLGGSRWQLINISTTKPVSPYASKLMEFRPDAHLITTTTTQAGQVQVYDESYRVVGDTLIINKPGYLINAKYKMDGNRLTVTDPGFSAVLERI